MFPSSNHSSGSRLTVPLREMVASSAGSAFAWSVMLTRHRFTTPLLGLVWPFRLALPPMNSLRARVARKSERGISVCRR